MRQVLLESLGDERHVRVAAVLDVARVVGRGVRAAVFHGHLCPRRVLASGGEALLGNRAVVEHVARREGMLLLEPFGGDLVTQVQHGEAVVAGRDCRDRDARCQRSRGH